jgi:hypothetical protein
MTPLFITKTHLRRSEAVAMRDPRHLPVRVRPRHRLAGVGPAGVVGFGLASRSGRSSSPILSRQLTNVFANWQMH